MGGFLACILAGAAMSIQGVMNTRLSEHIGTMETNAFVQCVAAVLSLLVLVFWRTGSFAALGAAPKYCWFGGVLALAITVTVMLGMGRPDARRGDDPHRAAFCGRGHRRLRHHGHGKARLRLEQVGGARADDGRRAAL